MITFLLWFSLAIFISGLIYIVAAFAVRKIEVKTYPTDEDYSGRN